MAKTRIRLNPNLRGSGLATAGLIINYTFLTLVTAAVCFAFFVHYYIKPQREKRLAEERKAYAAAQAARNAQRNEQYQQDSAANRIPYREPKLEIPTNAVSGQVAGKLFRYEHAIASQSYFVLREGAFARAERQISITTWVRPSDLAGKELLVTSDMRNPRLHITAEWLDAAKQTQRNWVTRGYYLRMKFGPIENGQMSGNIDLRMPGAPPTSIKGDFVAAVK
jgi:hypothetical protein